VHGSFTFYEVRSLLLHRSSTLFHIFHARTAHLPCTDRSCFKCLFLSIQSPMRCKAIVLTTLREQTASHLNVRSELEDICATCSVGTCQSTHFSSVRQSGWARAPKLHQVSAWQSTESSSKLTVQNTVYSPSSGGGASQTFSHLEGTAPYRIK